MADRMADLGVCMAYGDGTKPRKRADGRWIATVEAGYTERGTRRRRSVVGATEAECKRKLRDLRREMLAGAAVSLDPRMTVKRYSDVWIEDYAQHARPRTQLTAKSYIKKWIVPSMGNRRLSELTVADLRTLDADTKAGGLSATTTRNVRRVLHTILKAARAEGYAVPPSVLEAKKPRAAVNERTAMSVEQAATLLRAAADEASWPPAVPLEGENARRVRDQRRLALEVDASRWVAALLQGMRQGECLGLTWDCVDFERETIDISWQLQQIPADSEIPADYEVRMLEHSYALVRPKTDAGRRVIPLVPWMAVELKRWQVDCPTTPWGLVWPRASGMPVRAADDRDAWYGLQRAAGVSKSATPEALSFWLVHEARHTTVTNLMALRVPAEVIMAIVGHSSLASSAAYKHADLTQAREALQGVARELGLGPRDS